MKTRRTTISSFIIIGIIFVGGLLWKSLDSHSKDTSQVFVPGAPNVATVLNLDVSSTGGVAVAEPRERSFSARAPRPASAQIAKVFPKIIEEIRDWRHYQPEMITVMTHDDLPLTFTKARVKKEGEYVTWIGGIAALPGASFVGVATKAGYDAIVIIPGASQLSYHVRGDDVVMSESFPSEDGCGVSPAYLPRPPSSPAPGVILNVESLTEPGVLVRSSGDDEPPIKVDVLVIYNDEALADATARSTDPVGFIDGQAKAMLETGNVMLSQSDVTTFEWRYLGSEPMPSYVRDGKSLTDIRVLAPGGQHYDWTKMSRNYRGADQIIALIGGKMDYGGRAYAPLDGNLRSDFAVGVMRWRGSAFTMVHELAHNFGCHHDREHVGIDDETGEYTTVEDGDGLWHYGQMWNNPRLPAGWTGDSGTSGTIMSYAMWPIPYFSNPHMRVTVTGSMLGWSGQIDLGNVVIGKSETDPRAAYNVRVLNERGSIMSALVEDVRLPVITRQPASARFAPGTTISVSVAATGGGLRYQWKKDGIDIVDALSSTYSKRAVDADAGRYSVEVYNYSGRVMSADATITIGAPLPVPVTPPSNSGSGGGGGGGGSPSVWFYGALGVFGLIRWFVGARRTARNQS